MFVVARQFRFKYKYNYLFRRIFINNPHWLLGRSVITIFLLLLIFLDTTMTIRRTICHSLDQNSKLKLKTEDTKENCVAGNPKRFYPGNLLCIFSPRFCDLMRLSTHVFMSPDYTSHTENGNHRDSVTFIIFLLFFPLVQYSSIVKHFRSNLKSVYINYKHATSFLFLFSTALFLLL